MSGQVGKHSSCTGKIPYETSRKAGEVLNRRHLRHSMQKGLHLYLCTYCDKYHIGCSKNKA